MSKRTVTIYRCDACGKEIDQADTCEDWRGRNYGICEECCDTHYLDKRRLPESGDWVIRMMKFVDDGEPEPVSID